MTKTDPATLERLLAAAKRQTLQAIATADELAAVRRLLEVARQDTGQSKRVADFLLSWWNATACGGFDPTDLWCVDEALAIDMLTVIDMVARVRRYPPAFGLKADFQRILSAWRPGLVDEFVRAGS